MQATTFQGRGLALSIMEELKEKIATLLDRIRVLADRLNLSEKKSQISNLKFQTGDELNSIGL